MVFKNAIVNLEFLKIFLYFCSLFVHKFPEKPIGTGFSGVHILRINYEHFY